MKNKQSKIGAKNLILVYLYIMLCVSGIRSKGRKKGSENSDA
jgi:hypothetical protein